MKPATQLQLNDRRQTNNEAGFNNSVNMCSVFRFSLIIHMSPTNNAQLMKLASAQPSPNGD